MSADIYHKTRKEILAKIKEGKERKLGRLCD
jgi:hypothetical protein